MAEFEALDILVVEDEVMARKQLVEFLRARGASVAEAGTVAKGRELLGRGAFDLVLLDIDLPDGQGLQLLEEGAVPETTVAIVTTGDDTVETAVHAMRLGARDFVVKPYSFEEIAHAYGRAVNERKRERVQEHAQAQELEVSGLGAGADSQHVEQLKKVLEAERRLQGTPPPILLSGETGTGKTALAKWLHRKGTRASQPFVEINCASLSEGLAESELFGHVRGAFTDARETKMGLFEAASGGTLFLDEIASLSPAVQTKLLKAVEEQTIRRMGSNKPITTSTRVIAASITELGELVQRGEFREDLYHRLNLVHIAIPPLRKRRAELVALAQQILQQLSARYGRKGVGLSEAGKERLLDYDWPGNIRELRHELERALIFSEEDALDFPSLPLTRSGDASGADAAWLSEGWEMPPEGFSLDSAMRTFVDMALEATGGNISAAARRLGVPRHVLRYMIQGRKADSRSD